MHSVRNWRIWRSGARAIPGILVVGSATFICYLFRLDVTVIAFLYLIIVVLQSVVLGDFIASAVVSVTADLCLNFFFIPPIFSFRVSDSSDTWALTSFLVTGLVITRLITQVRQQAAASERQRHEMKLLYDLAQRLLALDPQEVMLVKAIALFREVFNLKAVCLYDGANVELYCDGDSTAGLGDRTRAAYISRKDGDDATARVFTRALRATGNTMGAVGFDGLRDADLTLGPLTALASVVLERERAFRDASTAEAAAQAEVFRGAILDALAHEFKTPLATIMTAAGGLRETSGLRAEQLELAELAEKEASRLARLTTRLLRVARLDREEVKPQLEITDIAELVAKLAEEFAERWTDRRLSLTTDVRSAEVLVDPELLRLVIRQLLDNACKYSPPGAAVTIGIERQGERAAIRVWNNGSPIAANERALIFERFYRGLEARGVASGSGLGLYVARKIAQAHGGSLGLEKAEPGGTAFLLILPTPDAPQLIPQDNLAAS